MKILVTGGAGYIGSVVVEQLIAAGESRYRVNKLRYLHKSAIRYLDRSFLFFTNGEPAAPERRLRDSVDGFSWLHVRRRQVKRRSSSGSYMLE